MKKGKIPAFFKVFIPELCSNKMQIPSGFTSYMKGKLPDISAFLRDRHKNVWPVEVIREGHDFFFEKGWVEFVEDNGVGLGDFLVFQFSGDYFYDFKHFDNTACEKETIRSFNFTVKQEESEDNEEEVDGVNDDNENGDDYEYEEEDDEGEEDEEDDEEDEDYEEGEDNVVRKIKMITPKKEIESSHARVQKPGTSTNWGKRKAVVNHEADLVNNDKMGNGGRKRGPNIFESGLIPQPKNSCFIARLQQRKRNELYIPLELIHKHNLYIPENITIIGEDGTGFLSKITYWKDGRAIATDGWRAFCRWNFVKMDELCLCEFVKHQELLVRILHFHAGKWVPRERTFKEEEEEEKDDEDNEEEEEEKDEEEGIEFETSSSRLKKAGTSTYRNKGKAGVERAAGSKNSVTVKGVEDIFASGLIDLPKNPYFVVRPRKRRDLRIPYEVITDHQLNIPEEIIITSEDGWEFVAAVSTWVDGRKVIVDGWRKFCERNKVTEEDCCLCEFLPPQSHKLLVRALHFHKGKWIPRP